MVQSQLKLLGSHLEWSSDNLVPVKELVVRINRSPWGTDRRCQTTFILHNQSYDGEKFAFMLDYENELFRMTPSYGILRPHIPTIITLTIAANTATRIRIACIRIAFQPLKILNGTWKSFWNKEKTSSKTDYARLDIVFLPDRNSFESAPNRTQSKTKTPSKSENFIERNKKMSSSSIKKTKSLQVKRKQSLSKEYSSTSNQQNNSVSKTYKYSVKRSASKWSSIPEASAPTKSSRTSKKSKPKHRSSKSKSRASKSSLLKDESITSIEKDTNSNNKSFKSPSSQDFSSNAKGCGSTTSSKKENVISKTSKYTIKRSIPKIYNPQISVSKESKCGASKTSKLITNHTPLLSISAHSGEIKGYQKHDFKSSISTGDTKSSKSTVIPKQKSLKRVVSKNPRSSLKIRASHRAISKGDAKSCASTKTHTQNTVKRSISKRARSVKNRRSQKAISKSDPKICGSTISHKQPTANKSVAKRSGSSRKSRDSKKCMPKKSTSKNLESDYPCSKTSSLFSTESPKSKERNKKSKKIKKSKNSKRKQKKHSFKRCITKKSAKKTINAKTLALRSRRAKTISNILMSSDSNKSIVKTGTSTSNCKQKDSKTSGFEGCYSRSSCSDISVSSSPALEYTSS